MSSRFQLNRYTHFPFIRLRLKLDADQGPQKDAAGEQGYSRAANGLAVPDGPAEDMRVTVIHRLMGSSNKRVEGESAATRLLDAKKPGAKHRNDRERRNERTQQREGDDIG